MSGTRYPNEADICFNKVGHGHFYTVEQRFIFCCLTTKVIQVGNGSFEVIRRQGFASN